MSSFQTYEKHYHDRGFGDGFESSALGEAVTGLHGKVRQRGKGSSKRERSILVHGSRVDRLLYVLGVVRYCPPDLIRLRKEFEGTKGEGEGEGERKGETDG